MRWRQIFLKKLRQLTVKVTAWIKEDPKLKENLRLLLIEDKNVNTNPAEENKAVQRLEERLLLLEKRLAEQGKKKSYWREGLPTWFSAAYNVAYVIVAIPVIIGLIYGLFKTFGVK